MQLPDLLLFEDHEGNWGSYFQSVYSQFERDFLISPPKTFMGKPVKLKWHPEYDGKSATFWHMISEGCVEKDRVPDIRRCERIAWIKFLIEKITSKVPQESDPVVWWLEKRGREFRYHISLSDFSYVVVVADREKYVLPWTAFYIEYQHQREKRRRKFLKYWEDIKAGAI